jgi:hypothetical protein
MKVTYLSVPQSQSEFLKVIMYLRQELQIAAIEVEESKKNYLQQGTMNLDFKDTVFRNNYTLFVV